MIMDEFGWSEPDAVLYLGVAMTCGGVIALCMFFTVAKLAQRFDERMLLIICGIIPMMIGRILMLPWPSNDHPPTKPENNTLASAPDPNSWLRTMGARDSRTDCDDEEEEEYCSHDWCDDQPAVYKSQFFIAFFINFFAYPYCVSICQSLFSKGIGPRPQVRRRGKQKLADKTVHYSS